MTRVYRYFLAHTGNPHDAEDLTSQTFIAALEGLRSFRGTGSFAAWIMGIAAKKRAGYFRSNHRETGLENESEIGGLAPAADQTVSQRLQVEKIHHALRQISPDRAEASVLTFFGGLNAAEAGRVLGKSEAAVRMLISRGLRDLRTRTVLAVEVDMNNEKLQGSSPEEQEMARTLESIADGMQVSPGGSPAPVA